MKHETNSYNTSPFVPASLAIAARTSFAFLVASSALSPNTKTSISLEVPHPCAAEVLWSVISVLIKQRRMLPPATNRLFQLTPWKTPFVSVDQRLENVVLLFVARSSARCVEMNRFVLPEADVRELFLDQSAGLTKSLLIALDGIATKSKSFEFQ